MPHFFEGNAQRASIFAIVEQCNKFGFGGTRQDVAHDMTGDVDGAVGLEGVNRLGGHGGQVKTTGGVQASFNNRQMGGVAFDRKEHAADREAHSGVGICGTIIEQLGQFCHGCVGPSRLFGSQFAESCKEGVVNGSGMEEQCAKNLEYAEFVGGVESAWRRGGSKM